MSWLLLVAVQDPLPLMPMEAVVVVVLVVNVSQRFIYQTQHTRQPLEQVVQVEATFWGPLDLKVTLTQVCMASVVVWAVCLLLHQARAVHPVAQQVSTAQLLELQE
jgi:hypothetical protein